jgi:hypothetical protein
LTHFTLVVISILVFGCNHFIKDPKCKLGNCIEGFGKYYTTNYTYFEGEFKEEYWIKSKYVNEYTNCVYEGEFYK